MVEEIIEIDEDEDLLYGTDYEIGNPTLPNNQLATISGIQNIHQAIEHRLMTPLGLYYDVLPDYGTDIRDFISMKRRPENIEWICFEIQALISQDERLDEVYVYYENDKGFIIEFKPIGSKETETINLSELRNNDNEEGEE